LPVYVFEDLAKGKHFDFIKIDTDSVDIPIIEKIIEMKKQNLIEVDAMTFEIWSCDADCVARVLYNLHHILGHTIYKLNIHDDRRFFDDDGNDTINNFQSVNPEPCFKEVYFLRGIRYAFEYKANSTLEDYKQGALLCCGHSDSQFFTTKHSLKEHHYPHPGGMFPRPGGKVW